MIQNAYYESRLMKGEAAVKLIQSGNRVVMGLAVRQWKRSWMVQC